VHPELEKLKLEGVLVVGVTQQQTARVKFEDDFTRSLSRAGVLATASHTLLPQALASRNEIVAAAESADLDTILIARYIGQTAGQEYRPGAINYGVAPAYGSDYYRDFDDYFSRAYEVAYQQPVWTNKVTYTLVSDLYVASTGAHLWQAVSETLQGDSTEQVRDKAIKKLVKDLRKQGLLR
jgi:hypothetical protein